MDGITIKKVLVKLVSVAKGQGEVLLSDMKIDGRNISKYENNSGAWINEEGNQV